MGEAKEVMEVLDSYGLQTKLVEVLLAHNSGGVGVSNCVHISQRTVTSIHVDGKIPNGVSEYHLSLFCKWRQDPSKHHDHATREGN